MIYFEWNIIAQMSIIVQTSFNTFIGIFPYHLKFSLNFQPDSLYNYGMKPLMYSEKDALQKKIGWRRCGLSIKYYRNNQK